MPTPPLRAEPTPAGTAVRTPPGGRARGTSGPHPTQQEGPGGGAAPEKEGRQEGKRAGRGGGGGARAGLAAPPLCCTAEAPSSRASAPPARPRPPPPGTAFPRGLCTSRGSSGRRPAHRRHPRPAHRGHRGLRSPPGGTPWRPLPAARPHRGVPAPGGGRFPFPSPRRSRRSCRTYAALAARGSLPQQAGGGRREQGSARPRTGAGRERDTPARGAPSPLPPRRPRVAVSIVRRGESRDGTPLGKRPSPRRGGGCGQSLGEAVEDIREAPARSSLPLLPREPGRRRRPAAGRLSAAASRRPGAGREEGRRGRRDAVRRDATGPNCKSSRPLRCRGKGLMCGGSGSGAAGPVS